MQLGMLRDEVANRVVFLLDDKVGTVGDGCGQVSSSSRHTRVMLHTGEGDLFDLLLVLAKGEELEPIAGLAPAYPGALQRVWAGNAMRSRSQKRRGAQASLQSG